MARSNEVHKKKGHDGEEQTCHQRFCCSDKSDRERRCSCGHHGRAHPKLGPNQYSFSFSINMIMDKEGSKPVEITGANDKWKITAVFCGTLSGDFLPLQLIYKGKTACCHPRFNSPVISTWHNPTWSSRSMRLLFLMWSPSEMLWRIQVKPLLLSWTILRGRLPQPSMSSQGSI